MSVSTRGFVATNIKSTYVIGKFINKALKELIKQQRSEGALARDNTFPIIEIDLDSQFLIYRFTYKGESRDLFVFFDCDTDCSEAYVGSKIIWSLWHWGNAEEIVMAICKHFYDYYDAPVYFQPEDTRDDNWILLEG